MTSIRSTPAAFAGVANPTATATAEADEQRRRYAANAVHTALGVHAAPATGTDVVPRNAHSGALPKMHLTLLDGSKSASGMPVPQPLAKGPVESRDQARIAAAHIRQFDSIMRQRWNRAGWDDKGGNVTAVVNARSLGGNAFFSTGDDGSGLMAIGVADARIGFRKSPVESPSILFHEYVHGIVGSELLGMPAATQALLGQREFKAVNESIADVLSTGLLGTGWRNGQEIRNGAPLRDLAEPSVKTFTGAVRKDSGMEEHTISGIVSRAAVVASESAGTLPVVDAWYAGIDHHFRTELLAADTPNAGKALGAWVRATMKGAEDVGGKGSALVEAMRSGWGAVGLGRYATDEQVHGVKPKPGAGRHKPSPANRGD